jgi:hypothetical protein
LICRKFEFPASDFLSYAAPEESQVIPTARHALLQLITTVDAFGIAARSLVSREGMVLLISAMP